MKEDASKSVTTVADVLKSQKAHRERLSISSTSKQPVGAQGDKISEHEGDRSEQNYRPEGEELRLTVWGDPTKRGTSVHHGGSQRDPRATITGVETKGGRSSKTYRFISARASARGGFFWRARAQFWRVRRVEARNSFGALDVAFLRISNVV